MCIPIGHVLTDEKVTTSCDAAGSTGEFPTVSRVLRYAPALLRLESADLAKDITSFQSPGQA